MKKYAVFTSLLVLAACDFGGACSNNENNFVNVQGECLKKVRPDKASITFTVNNLKSTSQEAASATQLTYKNLATKLKEKNFELETTSYTLNEDFSWDNKGVRKSMGWRAHMGIEVSTKDIGQIGEAINIASGFENVESGSFNSVISPELYKKEKDECLSIATQDARRKADAMLQALGAKTGDVKSISESYVNFTQVRPRATLKAAFAANMEMDNAGSGLDIETKEQDLKVGVNASFEIEN